MVGGGGGGGGGQDQVSRTDRSEALVPRRNYAIIHSLTDKELL